VVTRLYDAVREAMARPNIRDLLATFGAATEATPPEAFARFLEKDFATQQRWARDLGVIPK
jgi:tripartite-type tricarboxylate transporter receptor subunit TctC